MAAGRFSYGTAQYVDAPAFTPTKGGLLDVADVRDVASGDPAMRGYRFESEVAEVALGTVSGFTNSATTALTEGLGHQYEVSYDPFTVYGAYALDAGAGETEASAKSRAEHRLQLGEGLAAERALWESATTGIIPAQATTPRGTPGTAVKAKLAVGFLMEWWAASNNGVPYFHAGKRVSAEIAANQLVEFSESDAQVAGGAVLINGAGYYAKSTINSVTPTADQAWLVISGRPLLYRSPIFSTTSIGVSAPATASNNRISAFAFRTYVPSIDGPIGAVLVDLTA